MKKFPISPLILHCHIPKTAGVTVSEGLRKSFDALHLHHNHPDPLYILTRATLEQLLEISPALRSMSSHHLRSYPASLRGRPTFLMTFLRKPVDTFISQLKYAQRNFSVFPPEVQRNWPKETPQLPLRELARQYLEMVGVGQDFCPQTRFFCNPTAMAKFGLSDGNEYGTDSYEVARSILGDFHFVGIVDEMKKSLELLTDALAQCGVAVYFNLDERRNCSSEKGRPAWLTVKDDVGRRVLEASKSDRLLYQHFREVLLASHRKLQERQWLGFRAAAINASEAFRRERLAGAARSLARSGRLFGNRRESRNTLGRTLHPDPSPDLLEERAARAFADRTQSQSTAKVG